LETDVLLGDCSRRWMWGQHLYRLLNKVSCDRDCVVEAPEKPPGGFSLRFRLFPSVQTHVARRQEQLWQANDVVGREVEGEDRPDCGPTSGIPATIGTNQLHQSRGLFADSGGLRSSGSGRAFFHCRHQQLELLPSSRPSSIFALARRARAPRIPVRFLRASPPLAAFVSAACTDSIKAGISSFERELADTKAETMSAVLAVAPECARYPAPPVDAVFVHALPPPL